MTTTQDRLVKDVVDAIQEGRQLIEANIDVNTIRLHSYVEHLVDVLLTLKLYGDPARLKNRGRLWNEILGIMGYGLKVKVLFSSGTISKALKKELQYISNPRIPHAHPNSRGPRLPFNAKRVLKLQEDIIDAMMKSIDRKAFEQKRYEVLLDYLRGPKGPNPTTTVAGERTPGNEPHPKFTLRV